MSIRRKLILYISLFFSLIIFTIITISYQSFRSSSTNNNLLQLDITANSISKAVAEKMNVYFNVLEYSSNMFRLAPSESDDELAFKLELLDDLRNQL